ncbi:FYVE, RhoGEF and PH domain-containing protein 4 [Lamellibrachia satsuma]|nr:FYVE, RhoGEF and PH domain-containing protein 4 [Lamellibrachia satsuma]
MGQMYREAAVSITITSTIDIIALILESHSSIPGLQILATNIAIGILEDEDLEIPNSFVVKSKQKVIQLLAKSPKEKVDWQETQTETLGMQAPSWTKDQKAPKCMQCSAGFTPFFRRHHCRACGHVVCGNCTSHKVPLPYNDQQNRVCDTCHKMILQGDSAKTKHICGFLHISTDTKRWQKQYFVVYNDFVLRSFKDAEDSSVVTSMPLSGNPVSEAHTMRRRYV